jgi:NhaP-type Na+/H+ or K+/H+ antiporter
MVDVDPYKIGAAYALLLGLIMFAGGMYARRGGHLRNRQGAAVLAGFAAVIGVLMLGAGIYALVA